MNKVIAAIDGLNVSESTLAYSVYLSKNFNSHIVAAFLEDIVYHLQPGSEWIPFQENEWKDIDTLTKKEDLIRTAAVKKVQKTFDADGVHYNIHHDDRIAIQSLIRESHFADMILIEMHESFSNWDKSKPSHFIKNLLADADCPVMLVPRQYNEIDKFILMYDGSPSSVFAIRLFTYLFPVMPWQQVELLSGTKDEHNNHLPEQRLLKELLKRKYPVVLQSIVKSSDTTLALMEYLKLQPASCMAVLGAYQRSSFSRWLNRSIADTLISELDIPLFIAHR